LSVLYSGGAPRIRWKDTEAHNLLTALAERHFADKETVINRIAAVANKRAEGCWNRLPATNWLALASSGQFIIVTDMRPRLDSASALTGENLGEFSRRDIDTVRVNNALRGEWKTPCL